MFPELKKDAVSHDTAVSNYKYPNKNLIIECEEEKIIKSETRLGFAIPSQLRQFYQEFGYGFISLKPGAKEEERSSAVNLIVDPDRLADLYLKEDPDWMADEDLVDV